MIKGKQTGAGTEHNEIIRDVVVAVVVVFSAFFPLSFSSRLALAMRVYFPNRDAERVNGTRGDSDAADKQNARLA